MEPKYAKVWERPQDMKSNCRPGSPQRSAGGGRWKSWALLWLTWVSCQGHGKEARGVWADCTTGFHCDWLELAWYARSRWAYFLAFSVSRCTAPPASLAVAWRWESQKVSICIQLASHTKNLPFNQGTMVTPSGWFPWALYTGLTVPVCWECLLMPMKDGWHCLASDEVRLSHDLTCSLGHDVQICQQIFHTGYMLGQTYIWGYPLSGQWQCRWYHRKCEDPAMRQEMR